MRLLACLLATVATIALLQPARGQVRPASVPARGTVALLHSLARSPASMRKLERALQQAGWRVCNIGYPSRRHPVEVLATAHVLPALRACQAGDPAPLHFVTHSLGGIVVRQLAASTPELRIGRVVMLGPPNGGSEVVDRLGGFGLFGWLNGPAGAQLGTGAGSVPRALGPAAFELGVIAGDWSINWLLSALIPGPDDGKVAVGHTRLAGMRDHLVLPATHPFLMRNREAIRQVLRFLETGRFDHGQ